MTDREKPTHASTDAPCAVSLVADFNHRYPGDDVTLYSRVTIQEPVSGFRLQVTLPKGLAPGVTRAPDDVVPLIALDEGTSYLLWDVKGDIELGDHYEYQVEARVAPTNQDQFLQSHAVVTPQGPEGESLPSDKETLSIHVSAKGRYLNYLPVLYNRDELLGRFLMLFESFWAPISGQIKHLPLYFDPMLTPSDLLPWLASWLDLVLDERWPEEQRRLLLRSAASLYRKRGTKRGLQEYLEVFTGEKAEIIEHRANNFRLGLQGKLGPGIALGTDNMPHTFTVLLRSPLALGEGDEETIREEMERRRIIQAIIKAEKPAHTGYTLRYETDQPAHAASQPNDQTEG
jgi:phage tail-like protein